MKRIAMFLAVMALSVVGAFAQDAQIADLKNQLNGLFQERGNLHEEYNNQGREKTSLDSQGHDVVLDQQQYDKALAKHNDWSADQNKRCADHDLAVANVTQLFVPLRARQTAVQARFAANQQFAANLTANRCFYPPDNPGYCSGYEQQRSQQMNELNQIKAEAAQIDAEAAPLNARVAELNVSGEALNSEGQRVNADKAQIEQQGQNLDAAIKAYKDRLATLNAAILRHNNDWQENEAKIARILATLKSVGVQVDDCQNALKDTGDGALENIHAVCGSMFDGNTNMKPTVNNGTGGVTPN
jgi:chromosome segregation ATPase